MKKLFLSLSVLTMAFSQINAFSLKDVKNQLAKPFRYKKDAELAAHSFKQVASNAKVAVVTAPAMLIPASARAAIFAGMVGCCVANKHAQDQKQAELNRCAEKLAKAKMIGAQMAEEKANIEAGIALQSKGFRRVKNAILNAGSSVKTNIQAHPRIAGAALATALTAGAVVAYKKFGKAAKKPVVTEIPVKPMAKKATQAETLAKFKKPKKHGKAIKGYGKRK